MGLELVELLPHEPTTAVRSVERRSFVGGEVKQRQHLGSIDKLKSVEEFAHLIATGPLRVGRDLVLPAVIEVYQGQVKLNLKGLQQR